MKDRTWSVRVSFNWTTAPAVGLSSGSTTWPCRLRTVGSSLSFLFCPGRIAAHASARTATNMLRDSAVRDLRCMNQLPLLLGFGDQQQGCIVLLLVLDVNVFMSRLKPR